MLLSSSKDQMKWKEYFDDLVNITNRPFLDEAGSGVMTCPSLGLRSLSELHNFLVEEALGR